MTYVNFQKLALSAGGASALGLGMGVGVGGMFPGLKGGVISNMVPSGAPVAVSEIATKVVCLSQVSTLWGDSAFGTVCIFLRHVNVGILGAIQNFQIIRNDHIEICFLLLQVVSLDDLKDDGEFHEIVEDMREECSKYGK